MRSHPNAMSERLWPLALIVLSLFVFWTPTNAATLPVVKPASACADLARVDFTGLDGAPARIDAAEEVAAAGGKAGYCKVTGYIASDVRFEVRLPLEGWTQRFP